MPVRMQEGAQIAFKVNGSIRSGTIVDPDLEDDGTKVLVATPDFEEFEVLVADVIDPSAEVPAPAPPKGLITVPPATLDQWKDSAADWLTPPPQPTAPPAPLQPPPQEPAPLDDADYERMMAEMEGGVAPMDMDDADARAEANAGWMEYQQEMAVRDAKRQAAIAATEARDNAPDVRDPYVAQAINASGSMQKDFNKLSEPEKQNWLMEMRAFRKEYGFSADPKTILLLTEGVEGDQEERELYMWQMKATNHLMSQVPPGTPWDSINASLFLLHDVGLGKTITAILSFAAVYKLNKDPAKYKTMIIVPKSMLEIWRREFLKWTVLGKDKILVADKQGDFVVNRDPNSNQPLNYDRVKATLRHLEMAHVILTTPDVLMAAFKTFMHEIPGTKGLSLPKRLRAKHGTPPHPLFDMDKLTLTKSDEGPRGLALTIVDEVHQVSNSNTYDGAVTHFFAMRSKFKLGLSGTAVTNKPTQLADLAYTLNALPEHLRNPETYEDPVTKAMRREGVVDFHKLLADRVLKSFAGELPNKLLVTFKFDPFVGLRPDGTMNMQAVEMHTKTLEKGWWKSEDPATRAPPPAHYDGLPITYIDIVLRLMMFEFSSLLGMHGADAFDLKEKTGKAKKKVLALLQAATTTEASQVMELVARVIKDRQAAGHPRIAVYCHYLAVHRILMLYLEDRDVGDMFFFDSQFDAKKRADLIVDFKACEKGVLFLTEAGGTGITLSPGCEVMLSVGPLPWNATEMDQAFGRVHRIGQDKDVEIIQFVAHRSVTESKLKYHDDKRERLGKAAMDADFSNFAKDDQWRETGNILAPCARLDAWGNFQVLPAQVDALRLYQEKLSLSGAEEPTPPADWPKKPVLASRVVLPHVSFPLVEDEWE